MLMASVFTALYTVLCVFLFNYSVSKKHFNIKINLFVLCAVIGLLLRFVLAYRSMGHSTDMNCFSAWADMLSSNGIGSFYSSDTFTDYPPGYMYILTVLGYIKNAFAITRGVENMILRSPAIICDIIAAGMIYHIGKKNFSKEQSGLMSVFYIFNPAVILNSSLWGQVDAVYLVFIIAALYFVMKKRLMSGFAVFALAVLFKPQSLILSPVFIFASVEYLFSDGVSKKKNINFFASVIVALLVLILPMIPFGLSEVIKQYGATLSQYAYATVNAFNLWGALGLNWTDLNLALTVIGYVFIALICVVSAMIYFKTKNESKYFVTAAFLYFATYMLSTKMHERYAFCAIALAFIAYIFNKQRKHFMLFLFITVSQLINTAWVLYVYETDISKYFKSAFIIIASVLNIILFAFMVTAYLKERDFGVLTPSEVSGFEKSDHKTPVKRYDIIAVAVITVFYSAVALYNLGSRKAPETEYHLTSNSQIDVSFNKEYPLKNIAIFNGSLPVDEDNTLTYRLFDKDYSLVKTLTVDENAVFEWRFDTVESLWVQHIIITASEEARIKELAFIDETEQEIIPVHITDNALCDEQDTLPERSNWYNSTYFDEIYHARTAYEFINGLDVYEWTHPPLGKIFISWGVKLFGMNPFGWRITGTVFGILMLPFIFLFAKKITKSTKFASVTTLIFAFDFMHFTQTRIATIDVYITFFVILMYYFMYSFYKMSFYDTSLKKTFIPLLLSGICFGLGGASKWTGVYAGAGLCVLFFMTVLKRYKEYLFAKENPHNEASEAIAGEFAKKTVLTLLFCVIAFIVIPVVIYLLSYIPYLKCEGGGLATIIKNQKDMFVYHSSTVLSSTHPYSSKWYEWIIMKRPIWYFSGTINENLKEGISAFGNPLVWWPGIAAVLFMIYRSAFKKDKTAIFITVGYFAQLIPWMFVDRVVFIYHYFPSTVFLVLAIGYSLHILYTKNEKMRFLAYAYAAATVLMFFAFYPVLSGMPADPEWVYRWLKWFGSWVLI